MSQENVDVIHRLYAVMRSRDPRTIVASVDPEVEWVPDQRVGEPAVRGRQEVFEFFLDRASVFGEVEIEVERLMDRDDKVLAFVRVTGAGGKSGAEFDIRIAHLWTLRDGVIVRGEGYGDRAEGHAAFGAQ